MNTSDSDLESLLPDNNHVNWNLCRDLDGRFILPSTRIGKNTLPFKNTLVDVLNSHVPTYQPNFNETFSQVSDHRYFQLKSQLSDRPWIILWSGGIDSTLIVTSVLKNSTSQDRQNIFIACNESSIYENPKFFTDHILPNFSVMQVDDFEFSSENFEKYYVINGNPADALYCQFFGIIQALDLRKPGVVDLDLRNHSGQLIDIMCNNLGTTVEFAEYWWSFAIENIDSQTIPVETIHDFFWYNSFNFNWSGTKLRELALLRPLAQRSNKDFDLFWSNYIFWYDSDQYQLWSMSNNQPGQKFGKGPAEFKLVARQYIHSYNKDDYYLQFKLKTRSSDLYLANNPTSQTTNSVWGFFCLLDDFSELNLPQDRELIQSLLPDFFDTQK